VALCINDGGIAGPCSGLTPSQVIARIISGARSAASSGGGYIGDPLTPIAGKYFGYLVNAGLY
jgi:hypothetical protein